MRRNLLRLLLCVVAAALLLAAPIETVGQCGPGGCPSADHGPAPRQFAIPNPQSPIPNPSSGRRPVQNLAGWGAVVRVGNDLGGSKCAGTGVIVTFEGEQALVTAAHTFRARGQPYVQFLTGEKSPAKLVHADQAVDIAVLVPESIPASIRPVKLAAGPAEAGTEAVLMGYGRGDRLSQVPGRVRGYVTAGSANRQPNYVAVSGGVEQRDSGGPIFNRETELVATITATDGRETYGPNVGQIRIALKTCKGLLALGKARRAPTAPPPSPPPAGPQVIVHTDPAVTGSLGQMQSTLDQIARNTAPPPVPEQPAGPVSWIVIVLVVAAVGSGVTVFYVIGQN
jgi:hypothetical protein